MLLEWMNTHATTLMGLVWMVVLGPAVGNYACSVVYRLPIGKTPFERHPFCGSCNANLKPIDLFPIISYLSTRGKCRYCAASIPGIYTLIEVACLAIFVGYYLAFGMGEQFLLAVAAGVFIVILAAIQWQQGWLSASIYSYAWVCILLIRTLRDASIFPAIQGSVVALILAAIVHYTVQRIRQKPVQVETPYIWWAALLGLLLPMPAWNLFAVPLGILLLGVLCREKQPIATIVAWAGSMLLLIPQ